MTATRALMRGILKIFGLSLSEILPDNLVETVSVSCSYRRQILHIWLGSEVIEN